MPVFNMPIIYLAISLLVAWMLFSIICSLLHESIARLKSERGRFMRRYLQQQLMDTPNGLNWAVLIYQQAPIALLTRAPEKPSDELPPALFAQTLIDTLTNLHLVRMERPSELQPHEGQIRHAVTAALDVLNPSDVVALLNQASRVALIAVSPFQEAGKDLHYFRALVKELEQWFEAFGRRVSLWYKKKTKQRLFILGLLLALLLNIDAVELFDSFLKQAQGLPGPIELGFRHNLFSQPPGNWLLKITGLTISGLAASTGAPFWFDLMRVFHKQRCKHPG